MIIRLRNCGKKMLLAEDPDKFPNPEYINDKPETCPNRRIGNVIPEYQKDPFGTIIANSIGLDKIRTECPHFHEWLEKLEMLN